MPIAIGDCFWFDPDGARNDHFWAVIADDGQGNVVLANASSTARDQCCRLEPTDHVALSHVCWIRYDYMRFVSAATPILHVARYRRPPPLTPPVLARIQDGAHLSRWTAGKFLRLIPRSGL